MTSPTPYITPQDLEDRFGPDFLLSATDPRNSGEVDQAAVSRAIADATDLINSYLGKRYVLPLAVVPGTVVRIAADLARYFLLADNPGEEITKRYNDGLRWLRDAADGKVSTGLPEVQVPASSNGKVIVSGSPRLFSRKTLRGY
ncbi:protein of unknown function [Pseudogulbenkiania sp. NH8B]|uniref:gp436 family protein n=1 Tax=Pseudogulbenkiania sp. (strain NH8B) TaxID=748280 RepID=UPI0002279B5B|nr:DUF1320 domain-containing protein [Pseudogulbenkiania sp. NH8B]BAK76496.1 protein of unknown function [Pseudogulbenkiania sp. NH8B]BAK76925.1 protein of unknown function [Pseudogulbenkiania sp. NH8B]